MATGSGMVLQYFIGSSKGSADKTAAMMGFRELSGKIGKRG